ncbi:MAG: hypothetical protein JSV76_05835, partial [Candidatus Bathyarchaeota archaeon]
VQVGDHIEIHNGYIIMYRNLLQIRLGRKGSYEIIRVSSTQPPSEDVLVDSLNPSEEVKLASSINDSI